MRLLPCLLLALAVSACTRNDAVQPGTSAAAQTTIPFRQDGTLQLLRDGQPYFELAIEIADTDSARERGLMQRAPLEETQGMLFIFPHAGPQTFWMANTPSSLDIIFASADSTILNVGKYTRPLSTDGVSSQGAARFVLEVRAGFADRHGVVPGDKLWWTQGE